MRGQVPVNAVVRNVDLAADKPFHERRVPLERFRPLLEPHEFLRRQLAPKLRRLLLGALVKRPVSLHALHVGMLDKVPTWGVAAILGHRENVIRRRERAGLRNGDALDCRYFRSRRNASSASSRFSVVCAAVTQIRRRAAPWGTAGNRTGVTTIPSSRSLPANSAAGASSPKITGITGVSEAPTL